MHSASKQTSTVISEHISGLIDILNQQFVLIKLIHIHQKLKNYKMNLKSKV